MLYKIVYKHAHYLYDCSNYIEKEVAKLMEEGWRPQGGISVSIEPVGYSSFYTLTQAMVKPED